MTHHEAGPPPPPPLGLGALRAEPASLHPPFRQHPERWDRRPDQTERYLALVSALGEIEVGSYDVRVLGWLAGLDAPTVATICSLLHRARANRQHEANGPA